MKPKKMYCQVFFKKKKAKENELRFTGCQHEIALDNRNYNP